MKRRHSFAAVALVAMTSLIGCGQELSTSPVMDLDAQGSVSDAVIASSGKAIFEACEANAVATLSLSDLILITPYLNGTKTLENSTLSEIVEVTPAVTAFQAAFEGEMSVLSVGDALKVTSYMKKTGKNQFPYPELGSPSEIAA